MWTHKLGMYSLGCFSHNVGLPLIHLHIVCCVLSNLCSSIPDHLRPPFIDSFAPRPTELSQSQGFIQKFSVGVGKKNMCIEPHPLGGCGVMLLQKFTCSEVASGGWFSYSCDWMARENY